MSNGVKSEDVKIKLESDQVSTIDDDDQYEDTGELLFPKQQTQAWLLRTPKELWTGLSKLKPEEQTLIGQVRIWNLPNGQTKVRWNLEKNVPGFDLIAKEYDLQIQPDRPSNLFCFSEKDLPGFRSNAQRRAARDARKTEGGRVEKRQRIRTITKHTSFVSAPDHDVSCTPRETDEWRKLQARKAALELSQRKQLKRIHIRGQNEPGKAADTFIKGSDLKKTRPQGLKYQRLEEHALIDALAVCFREYTYWTIKALQDRLKQPEAHLREVLGKIAFLVKSGQAANNWTLKPEIAATILKGSAQSAGEIAPEEEGGEDEEVSNMDFDEDDDEDMEDVDV